MQITETKNEGLTREFTVRLEAKDIADKVDTRLGEIGKDVTLPGFRPGKAPLSLLQKRYGKAVMGEILQMAVNDTSTQTIAERGLTPAVQPRIEITSYEDGADLEYTMQVELMPEFEPADFSKIELERIVVKVTDKEVDESLERIAKENRRTEAVSTARAAKTGDTVVIDFVGKTDGVEFPGGAGKDFHLELGSGRFIPGFEEQLAGVKTGDKVTVKVSFPEDYQAAELAGKDAEFDVDLKEIREHVDAPADDALAVTMGLENLAALRDAVRDNMEREYAAMSRTSLKRRLLDSLAESHDFDVPAGMAEAEFEAIWKQLEDAREQGQIDEDDADKSDDELKAEYRQIAERRVRLGLLLSEVGRRNSIDVTQDEVNRALMTEAQRYPGQQQQVIEHYQNNPQAIAEIRAPLFENKVTDFILELARVKERTGTMEDLLAAEQAQATGGTAKKKAGEKKKSAKASKPAKSSAKPAGDESGTDKKPASKADKKPASKGEKAKA